MIEIMPPSQKQYYTVLLDRPEGVFFFCENKTQSAVDIIY